MIEFSKAVLGAKLVDIILGLSDGYFAVSRYL